MVDVSTELERWLITGVAITIPLVVTLIVLMVVVEFVLGLLSPVVAAVAYFWADEPPAEIIQLTTLVSLVAFFLLVGATAEHTPGERLSRMVHRTVETIPLVSTIYSTVRRASDVLVDDDTDQFQEVKLVEFPHQEAYMLGFLTADTPATIAESAGIAESVGPEPGSRDGAEIGKRTRFADGAGTERDASDGQMQTIMVPLGPNPTTNGFVLHVPRERIHDVDLSVEEAVRSIATLGVATGSVVDDG